METITYKLEHFEGPLDLLLHLIEKNKVDIYDIPIVEITAQYLEYVRNMEREDLNLVSEFLVMAATLLDIKAKMLLPKEGDVCGPKFLEPYRDGKLLYPAWIDGSALYHKRYKILAEELADREENAAGHFYKASSLPPEVAKYRPPTDLDELLDGLTLAKLQRIFEQAMKRKEYKVDPIRSKFGTIHREPVSLEQKITSVMDYARKARRFSFRQLLEKQTDKLEVVVTFLAILELMKIGKIHLTQEETFGEMDIETIEPEGQEEDLNLEQVSDLV